MFKIVIFVFLVSFTALKANAAGPAYRDFLVEQQPMPAGLQIKQDLIANKTNLKLKNSKASGLSYHKKTFFDASPIFISDRSTSFSVLGVGYMRDQFVSLQTDELSKYYSGAYASFYAIAEVKPSLVLECYTSYGIFSEKNVNTSSNSDKTFSFAILAYKRNSRQVFKLGVMHDSNFGKDILLPVLGLSYSRGSYILDVLLPSYISLRKIHSKKFHSIVRAELSYSSYYDHNRNDILEISGIESGAYIEYNVHSYVWLQIGVIYAGEKQLTWLESNDNFATIKGVYKLNSGISIRF